MQKYIGTKIILATAMTLGAYNEKRGWPMPPDEDPAAPGYLVEYTDGGKPNHPDHKGYISWSPKEQFEGAYRSSPGLTFGHAIEALKRGCRVCRVGWNGKGMYLEHYPSNGWARLFGNTTDIANAPFIGMKTADNKLVPWLASQTDMLAEDWTILDEPEAA